MSRRVSCLVAAALVLMAALAAAVAAGEPITPKLGLYHGQVVGPAVDGEVEVHETDVKVVKVGKRQGAQVSVSPFSPTSCTGDQVPVAFSVLEKSAIPIENAKFKLDRTTHPRLAGGNGTGTMRTVLSGTFTSPTKVVVKVSVNLSYSIQYSGQPEVKGTCTGKQTSIAKHQ
jgi:hypothetical protein